MIPDQEHTMHHETRQMAAEIARKRGITQEQAEALVEGARGFWAALETVGFVDAHGGAEFDRIFPDVIEAIHGLANPPLV